MSENKVALITGATRGIGREIALELAENGMDIAINYRSESDIPEDLKGEIIEKIYKILTKNREK